MTALLEIEEAVKAAVESLQNEIKEVLESDLAKAFVARLEMKEKVSAENVDSEEDSTNTESWEYYTRNIYSGIDLERLRQQINSFKTLGEQLSQFWVKYAVNPNANQAQGAFLRAGNVAGGKLHQNIYDLGKLLGFKFKPYGAVNIAKGIGNVAKCLGPIVAVAALVGDNYADEQEKKQDKEIADAKREITSNFIAIAKDLESQIEAQLQEVEAQIYGETEKRIVEERQKEEDAIASSNQWLGEFAALRKEFEGILSDINGRF
ncbi:LeoA/HP0731 family dynamin-like GTPase [Chlorogloeopsis sp. ULAP02]|uniref:LeoA/HP0731 family dynamin-like GTPase n=1 Tax=Chlorogloeopsis sp. ULAP02 TaxID=3107926 RepID=UPI003135BE1C